MVGEVPELKNYFVAAGLNSVGILSGPGIGRLLAHWIKTGQPDMDVTGEIDTDMTHARLVVGVFPFASCRCLLSF